MIVLTLGQRPRQTPLQHPLKLPPERRFDMLHIVPLVIKGRELTGHGGNERLTTADEARLSVIPCVVDGLDCILEVEDLEVIGCNSRPAVRLVFKLSRLLYNPIGRATHAIMPIDHSSIEGVALNAEAFLKSLLLLLHVND